MFPQSILSNFAKEVCAIKQGQQSRASAKFIYQKAVVLVALLYYGGFVIFRLKWEMSLNDKWHRKSSYSYGDYELFNSLKNDKFSETDIF